MGIDEPSLPAGTELERWVRMRRRFDAPPDRVYRTWADPEELARWFPERVEGGLAVGSRCVLWWRMPAAGSGPAPKAKSAAGTAAGSRT